MPDKANSIDAVKRHPRRARRSASRRPERARFLSSFPENDELAAAVAAFVNGNYREMRVICDRIIESDIDPDVHDAARELLRRVEPDRLILGILWGSFALLALLTLWAYGHG